MDQLRYCHETLRFSAEKRERLSDNAECDVCIHHLFKQPSLEGLNSQSTHYFTHIFMDLYIYKESEKCQSITVWPYLVTFPVSQTQGGPL